METVRRLNRRYKGLLEPIFSLQTESLVAKNTKIDFFHRTLYEFLRTSRMKLYLESCLSKDFSACSLVARVTLTAVKLMHDRPPLAPLPLALKLAQMAGKETGQSNFEYEILDHIDYVYGLNSKPMPSGLGEFQNLMARVAISVTKIIWSIS